MNERKREKGKKRVKERKRFTIGTGGWFMGL